MEKATFEIGKTYRITVKHSGLKWDAVVTKRSGDFVTFEEKLENKTITCNVITNIEGEYCYPYGKAPLKPVLKAIYKK